MSRQTLHALFACVLGIAFAGAPRAGAQAGAWGPPLPPSNTGRYAPTATLLPSGRVLIAGGYNGIACVTSVQLFNPATNTWSPAPVLNTPRNFATATLLNSGNVLIAGGYNDSNGSLAGVQLYSPSTNTFLRARYSLTTPRELYTATLLPSGGVLMVGGYRTGYGTLSSAEVYNAGTGAFTRTGSMVTPYGRFGHEAVSLPGTTKILIVGGKEQTPTGWHPLATAELYDTATGKFTATGGMAYARDRCRAVWVPAAGRVLVTGGKGGAVGTFTGDGGDVLPCEWYDPVSGTFSPGPSLATGRMAHTLTALTDGSILVVGGWCTTLDRATETAERFVYDPASGGSWSGAGSMSVARHDHAAVLAGGWVLVFGGKQVDQNPGGTTAYPTSVEQYTP